MKKVYIAPQTEAIELLGANTIMTGSTIIGWGRGGGGFSGGGSFGGGFSGGGGAGGRF